MPHEAARACTTISEGAATQGSRCVRTSRDFTTNADESRRTHGRRREDGRPQPECGPRNAAQGSDLNGISVFKLEGRDVIRRIASDGIGTSKIGSTTEVVQIRTFDGLFRAKIVLIEIRAGQ